MKLIENGTGRLALMFAGLCAYAFNLGGVGYLFLIHKPQFAVASLIVASFSARKVYGWLKELL